MTCFLRMFISTLLMKPGDCKVSHLLTGVSCIVGAIFSITVYNHYQMAAESGTLWKTASSIYEFSAKSIDGDEVSLEKYRGDVCLIVNVASQ
ncbi:GPX4 [Bugula neritina]|uniref:GPX4 n=1 Tax=Bugula neritina TaxID=10212 RepID=A0A7J7J120_BUGNE|nr:GPX4 [Bugula neritina]